MELFENQPYEFILNASREEKMVLKKFVHRTFNGFDCIFFVNALKNIYLNRGGMQKIFEGGFETDNTIFSALTFFYRIFYELGGERSRKHVANVLMGASGKRLNMYLRWMVRNDDSGIDFGLWHGIPASSLMLPLDVHTGNVARKLGILICN